MSSKHQRPEHNTPVASYLAHGEGWAISDIVCNAGPHDQPFEEQHSRPGIGIVVSGTFQYRTSTGFALMTPGSILLGNPGDCFCCGHEHGTGDRCIAFSYSPDFLERVTAIPGKRNTRFGSPRIPALRVAAKAVVRATAYLLGNREVSAEELCVFVAGEATELARNGDSLMSAPDAATLSRVTRVVRMIDNDASAPHDLAKLAGMARLSPYHFLRVFEGVTGTTPHQYVLRGRLRRAALKLKMSNDRMVDIALDCGFGDVSNFNRTFRGEFGMSPRRFRSEGARRETK
jgi:AraC family transcriptional regulator